MKHSISYLTFERTFKTPQKIFQQFLNISAIYDDVRILRFRHMLCFNPKRSGWRDPSN